MNQQEKLLESLRSVLERKAEEFGNAREKSINAAKAGMQELKALVDFVESSVIREIEEAFETNRFAAALGVIHDSRGEMPEAELKRLGEVASAEVTPQLGPCRRDFQRAQERIIGLNSWSGKRSLYLPQHIEGRCVGAGSVEVVWDRVEEASGYHVEMRLPNEDTFQRMYEGKETSYRVDGLCCGARVLFRVRSVLEGSAASEWSECVEACTPSSAPQYLSAEGVSESEIAVRWDGVDVPGDEAPVYHVEMRAREHQGGHEGFKEIYSGSETMCAASGLESEEEYLFRVRAMCGGRCISRSNPAVGRTKIAAPRKFRARANRWDSINLSWCCVASRTGEAVTYVVEMKEEGDDEFTVIYRGARTKIRKTEFQEESEYSFRVRAVAKSGASEWSEVVKVRTEKPQGLSNDTWKECPSYVEPRKRYSVDKKNPKIAKNANGCNCTVIGNAPLPLNQATSWNVKILKSEMNNGSYIFVGVAPSSINQNESYNAYKCGWYLRCCDSTLWSGPPHISRNRAYGPKKKWGEYVHTGDIVGVVMDTAKGKLSFVLDGVNHGVAFEGVPLDKPLVPCALLYYKGDCVELDISGIKENVSSSVSAPSNVVAEDGLTCDSAIFSWDPVEGATCYQVEFNKSKTWEISKTNKFSKAGLLPETVYYFRVRTVVGDGLSEWSSFTKKKTGKMTFETGAWKECPKGKYITGKKNPRVVKSTRSWCTATWSTPLPPNKTTSWTIKILDETYTSSIFNYIGVAPSRIDPYEAGNNYKCGWYINCHDSTLCSGPPHEYKSKKYVQNVDAKSSYTGDSVGVVMDTAKGELSFVLNEVNIGVAYEGIPLDEPLVPCVLLGARSTVELII